MDAENAGQIRLDVHDLGWDGDGVGRAENGRVVMVTGALPGDHILARITHTPAKGPLRAEMEKVLVASHARVAHPCKHFSTGCPGSPLGCLDFDTALDWKRDHLIETLKRVGKVENPAVDHVVPSPRSWRYRDRLEMNIVQDEWGLHIGYRGREGQLIPIHDCLLGGVALRKTLTSLRESIPGVGRMEDLAGGDALRLLLRSNGKGGVIVVIFLVGKRRPDIAPLKRWLESADCSGWQIRQVPSVNSRYFNSEVVAEDGDIMVTHRVSGGYLKASPIVFSQANEAATYRLVHHVLDEVPRDAKMIDLYGGFGMFALAHIAHGGKSAAVFESSPEAVQAGKDYAEQHSLPATYQVVDLDKAGEWAIDPEGVVVLDPARSGASEIVIKKINSSGAKRVIYVSCHPAALARDVVRLTAYRPVKFKPLDMFPGTPDLETVAIFERI